MNILSTQYTLQTKSLDIYVSGCSGTPHCSGCHNPESWDFNIGDSYHLIKKDIMTKVKAFDMLIENIMIFGGEPLDQDKTDLIEMLVDLYNTGKSIWLFSRYDISDINDDIKKLCHFIKCGRYCDDLKTENNIQYGIKLSTSNQKIYKIQKGFINEQI